MKDTQASELKLTKTQIIEGVWEGVLSGPLTSEPPGIEVTHFGQALQGVTVTALADGEWRVAIPIPTQAISDGVQTFVITDPASGDVLETFAVLAGEALAEDIRAEIDLLREELDMLKRAFRRHCLETM